MRILALDLATVTGFAFGETGAGAPQSGSYRLKATNDPIEVAPAEVARWLRAHIRENGKPDLLILEHWMRSAAIWSGEQTGRANGAAIEFQCLLHGSVHAMCGIYGFTVVSPEPSTVRKHFIGRGNMGSKKETKLAVLNRCKLLRYVPKDCEDTDRSDAVAIWDWGQATYGKIRPTELVLFGEQA